MQDPTRLRGVYNIVPTPFADDGALDEASLGRLIDFVIGCGVDGVTILGVMGEAGKVSEAYVILSDAVTRRRFDAGDLEGATAVFHRYLPLIRFENQAGINLALRKHIYRLRGAIASARARAPFSPLDETTPRELDELIGRLGLAETLTNPGRLPAA